MLFGKNHRVPLPLHPLEWDHHGPSLQTVKIIRPSLHHLPTFFQAGSAVIRSSEWISDGVSKLVLDIIRTEVQDFIKDCSSHCSKAVTRHGVLVEPHPSRAALIALLLIGRANDLPEGKT